MNDFLHIILIYGVKILPAKIGKKIDLTNNNVFILLSTRDFHK